MLLPYPFAGPFDYAVPDHCTYEPGDIVLVPLNRRQEAGVVWDAPSGPPIPDSRLKPVAARLDAPPMPAALRRFIDWVAGYTLAAPGEVLAMALRVNALTAPAATPGWQSAAPSPLPAGAAVRLTPARRRVLQVMADGAARTAGELARLADIGPSVIRGMADAGLLHPAPVPYALPFGQPDQAHHAPALSAEQEGVARQLAEAVSARRFGVTLLDGVTGSGKTEVYLEAVAACLAEGRQALILLPEIALSAQFLSRFARRFGTAPAQWHSDLSSRTRRITWRAVARGEAAVVVGARSALFLPFPDLGLVVVDEEHETAFKQEDGVIYHARDMAVVRARMSDAPAILVSADAEPGDARQCRGRALPASAPDGTPCRRLAAACHRHRSTGFTAAERGRFLAPSLVEAVHATLAAGEQAMLFLNRRGYAPLTLCRACGHRLQCPNCTAWLVEHRALKRLACHHCGHAEPLPPACPLCKAEGTLAPIGPGVERITEEAGAAFPSARRLVMASDTMPGPNAAAEAARAIEAREVDLIIGTPDRRERLAFPASYAGRCGGCGFGAGWRRPARVGADGAVAAPGWPGVPAAPRRRDGCCCRRFRPSIL